MSTVVQGFTVAGARDEFFREYTNAEVFPWDRFALRVPSTAKRETYRGLGAPPAMREFGTGRLAQGLKSESYDIENEKYEATFSLSREEVEDDRAGHAMFKLRALGYAARRHPQILLASLLETGAAANALAYDGASYFSDAHPYTDFSGAAQVQDNDLTATAAAAKKTVAECLTALDASISGLLSLRDDHGGAVHDDDAGIVAVVPASMLCAMRQAANALIVAGLGGPNGIGVLTLPQLTLGTTFYTMKTTGQRRPFFFQERSPMEFSSSGDSDEVVFVVDQVRFGVRSRYALGYGYYQCSVRTVFNN
ncbi:MAG: Mu-like prophage major head subunit gpT family protein [Phycisphaerae bacterium]